MLPALQSAETVIIMALPRPGDHPCETPVPPPAPDLGQLLITDKEIADHVAARDLDAAIGLASRRAAAALVDLGAVNVNNGEPDVAIKLFREALHLRPDEQKAFHNLAATLLAHECLRGDNFDAVRAHIVDHWDAVPWVRHYRRLLYMPRFLNIEFVEGKCNLKCRMCLGTNSPGHPDRLVYLSADDFESMLRAAPTVAGITLSSQDSDPLLHPQFERMIDIAAAQRIGIDLFTNGLPLGAKVCRKMVQSGAIGMLNFSIDAATPETYRRIRGADLDRLIRKIEMLQSMKQEAGSKLPWVSLSFVAMVDNIHELPDFVDLAQRLGARRIYVESLNGWENRPSENRPATEHPRCSEFMHEAGRRAEEADIRFVLHDGLRSALAACDLNTAALPATNHADVTSSANEGKPTGRRLHCCGWIDGVWINRDGELNPCCMVAGAADMGNVRDGPLLQNDKYARVKDLLLTGKVFAVCQDRQNCNYVQQQNAAGIPLRVITGEELGDLHPDTVSCEA